MRPDQRDRWVFFHTHVLVIFLFLVPLVAGLSTCGSGASSSSSPPSTMAPAVPAVYFIERSGLVAALQSQNGRLLWHKQLGQYGSQDATLRLAHDVLYVGRMTCSSPCSSPRLFIGEIDALKRSDGALLWRAQVGEKQYELSSMQAQVLGIINGIVYVAVHGGFSGQNEEGVVEAIRADSGSLLWRFPLKKICCRGLVLTNTAIYLSGLEYVEAIKTNDGTLLWHHQLDATTGTSLGIQVANGAVYVGTSGGNIMGSHAGVVEALRASNGTLLWHRQLKLVPFLLTVAEGAVYVGQFLGQTLEVLKGSDGSRLWLYVDTPGAARGIIFATVRDSVAYVTAVTVGYSEAGSTLAALRTNNGTPLWRYQVAQGQFKEVEVANGMVYVITSHGLVALQATTGSQRWFSANESVLAVVAET
ncbi:MAG TPA: PQQ-binding-like beta-propeller repeat protein [Ktedonobacteraceae bacterium]|nr:PQQ-binding-like beta-propeller repeat protein [Ktedonobacteraceae bacterium]